MGSDFNPSKQLKVKTSQEYDRDYWQSVEEFSEVVLESLKTQYHSELEPFENYAQKVKMQVAKDVDDFRRRFVRGYHVLLEEVKASDNK